MQPLCQYVYLEKQLNYSGEMIHCWFTIISITRLKLSGIRNLVLHIDTSSIGYSYYNETIYFSKESSFAWPSQEKVPL